MDTDGRKPRSNSFFSKLFGRSKDHYENVTEREILMMVDAGNQEGVIEESEKEMINNILEFADVSIAEVMTHRVDLVASEEHDTIDSVVKAAMNEGFSRIPIYKNDIDNIIGVLYVKDLLVLIGCDDIDSYTLKNFIRQVLYVPETTKCRDLFLLFTEKKQHIAVVVDEYGGTAGIVTMEDLIESILGNIQDEYDDEEDEISKVNDTTYILSGSADLEDVSDILKMPLPDDPDYDTLGGFIVDQLGRIPNEGEHPVLKYADIEFTVLVVEERHIEKIRAIKLSEISEETDAD